MELTVMAAREWLQRNRREGVTCPTCDQFVKEYERPLNSGMARSIIAMYKSGADRDYIHLPTTIDTRHREEAKLRWWGLVEEMDERRPDGGRAGWWRLTTEGIAFVKASLAVPKYAVVYNNELIALKGPEIRIWDALGKGFSYAELMSGVAA